MNIENLITEHTPLVRDIARKFYFQNPVFSVEDLEQVGYLALWKSLKKYDNSISKISTFITVCVKNDIIKFINKQHMNNKRTNIDFACLSYSENNDLFDISQEEPDVYNEILKLRYEGFSMKDISARLSMSTVKIRKILKKIRKKYNEKKENPVLN